MLVVASLAGGQLRSSAWLAGRHSLFELWLSQCGTSEALIINAQSRINKYLYCTIHIHLHHHHYLSPSYSLANSVGLSRPRCVSWCCGKAGDIHFEALLITMVIVMIVVVVLSGITPIDVCYRKLLIACTVR